jgi:hypothetical protein
VPAITDPENQWLSFHESCLQGLGVDRNVRIYDELCDAPRDAFARRAEIDNELDRLEEELKDLRVMYRDRRQWLSGVRRPGVRREVLPKP